MSRTTIQVRRGYALGYPTTGTVIGGLGTPSASNTWASGSILQQGEIGFEVNTGRFKIGKDGSTTWSSLPYAGGSDIAPGSGISTIFNSSSNSYTIHNPLATGNNISLSQYNIGGDGLSFPSGSGFTIGLKDDITLRSISATGTGVYESTFNDLNVSGILTIGAGIDILLAAAINAYGGLVYNANPFIVNGSGIFTSGLFVGPSGSPTGVSLSGHQHSYTDITNFCTGVASCVDTQIVASTGLQLNYDSATTGLNFALSGQALSLHNLNTNGLIVRSGTDTVVSRTISASGSNILIGNGDGILDNPSIGLNPNLSITSLTTTNDITIGGNLVVQGDTITANVSRIDVEDPVIVLGGTGTITSADTFDRGLLLRYWDPSGAGAAATGFMGWDYNNKEFMFLSSTTGSISGNDYGAGTLGRIKTGSLVSTGAISGSNLYVTGATASTIAIFDGNKQIVSTGSPTLTELSYLSGVTSSIQTQLGGKVSTSTTITGGSGLVNNGGTTALSSDITLDIGQGVGISVASDSISVDSAQVVMITGTQTVSGVKTFDNGSTTNVKINTASNGTGTLTFQDGSDTATISWQGLGNNLVFDSSVAAGTFDFKKTIRYQVPSTNTTSTYIPVFTGTDPSSSVQAIASRSLANFKSDLSLNNVTNNSQMIAYAGRTSGYVPTWSGTDGTTLNNGYAVDSGNTNSSIVLRGSNGDFAAGNITATAFIGDGSSVTGVNAYNLNIYSNSRTETTASLVMISGTATGNYRPFIDSGLAFNASTDTLILKNASGNIASTYGGNNISIIGSTSLSGLVAGGSSSAGPNYLFNFIIDGGTP